MEHLRLGLLATSPVCGYFLGNACGSDHVPCAIACCFFVVPLSILVSDAKFVGLISFGFGLTYYGCGTVVMITATSSDFTGLWLSSVFGLSVLHSTFMLLLNWIFQRNSLHLGVMMAIGWPIFEFVRFFVTKLVDTHGLRLVDLGLVVSNDMYIGQVTSLCGAPLLSMWTATICGCIVQAGFPNTTLVKRARDIAASGILVLIALFYGFLARLEPRCNTNYTSAILVKRSQIEGDLIAQKAGLNWLQYLNESFKKCNATDSRIMFFPEASMDWYLGCNDCFFKSEHQESLLTFSKEEGVSLFIGAGVHSASEWVNACVVVRDGELKRIVPKKHLVPGLESRFPLLERVFLDGSQVLAGRPPTLPAKNLKHGFTDAPYFTYESDSIVFSSICYDLFFQETYGEMGRGCKMSTCLFGKSLDPSGTLDAIAAKHARLRAIETKRPFVFVADGGPCMVFSELGDRLPVAYEDFLVNSFKVPTSISDGRVALGYFTTPMICMAVAFVWLVVTQISRVRQGMTA